jgi:preprotein translocase subunit SecB
METDVTYHWDGHSGGAMSGCNIASFQILVCLKIVCPKLMMLYSHNRTSIAKGIYSGVV